MITVVNGTVKRFAGVGPRRARHLCRQNLLLADKGRYKTMKLPQKPQLAHRGLSILQQGRTLGDTDRPLSAKSGREMQWQAYQACPKPTELTVDLLRVYTWRTAHLVHF